MKNGKNVLSQEKSFIGVNFINILCARFSYEILAPKISTQSTAYVQNFGNKNSPSYEKCTHLMLMKLTPEPNLIKLLGAYLGAELSQVNRVRRLFRCLKVL